MTEFWAWLCLVYLALSIYLYCLLGGADYGAGILELFSPRQRRRRQEELSMKALGPVWEANHVWLIISIVILFVGFPRVYAELSTHFHIPLVLMLLGVVFRGCSFMFRHYDPEKESARRRYSAAFAVSSTLTPFMFGVLVGAIGFSDVQAEPSTYWDAYVRPWLGWLPAAVGAFTVAIFAYVASVFMIGETPPGPERSDAERRALRASAVAVAAGGVVFAAAEASGEALLKSYLRAPVSLGCLVYATFSMPFLWSAVRRGRVWTARVLVGFQIAAILLGWYAPHFPVALRYENARPLSLMDAAAPPPVLIALGWSLLAGSLFFLPLFAWLLVVFKLRDDRAAS